ncbi:MAG: hypothetical protein O3B13_08450 [Planctomycetota bacterium]|nr:hypothetical protein [Planctomycetota bacterium]MDA1163117.1 hypothetical protein [Planctomycetota bacterium]
MKTTHQRFAMTLALIVVPLFANAAGPQFTAVEGWLKPAPDMQSIGQAHGDVAVSSNGDVYVSVGGARGGVQVFDSAGKYLRNVPNAPTDFHGFIIRQEKAGEFIYGAQLSAQAILKMQLDGRIVLSIAGSTIPPELVAMRDGKPSLRLTNVDVAPDGRIFAVDGYSSDIIHVFDANGKYLESFGGKAAPFGFRTCHKIAIDTRFDPPRILCCDRENRRVVHLSIDGQVLSVVKEMKRPAAVAVFGEWAAIAEIEGRVSLLDKEGNIVMTLGANDLKEQTATNKVKPADWRTGILTAPHGLDFDSQGNLFVTEFNLYGRVLRYDLAR